MYGLKVLPDEMSGPNSRTVGMSRRNNPGPLLRTVGGKAVPGAHTKDEGLGNVAMITERPEDAPPEASSDEENQIQSAKPEPDSSDSEHDNRNADIVRTKFDKTTTFSTSSPGSLRKSTRGKTDAKTATSGSRPEGSLSSAGSKSPADDFVTNSGAHLKDKMGFIREQKKPSGRNGQGIRAPKKGRVYGKSSQNTSELASKRSRDEEGLSF